MIAKVSSATLVGLQAERVEVECDAGTGMFSFVVVGLPAQAVQESRERVRAAIKNSGFQFPRGRVTVNLAPADLRKEGCAFDLPIAVSILSAQGSVSPNSENSLILGELSLDGDVRGVYGTLSACMMARERGMTAVFVPADNAHEASLVSGLSVYPVRSLTQIMAHLSGAEPIPAAEPQVSPEPKSIYGHDMGQVRGQQFAKRALEIAAAGGHNVLLFGPPGSGKTLLARCTPSILPSMSSEEVLEVTRIYSAAGQLAPSGKGLVSERPFRSPHHTASAVALVGGGSTVRPGEISLAHRGVLFLDEFPEYARSTLEALRQPLEDGTVTVSRSAGTVQFPSRVMLVAAQNPCPCGYYGSSARACSCSFQQILSYHKRVSGPLLDRFDLFIEVPPADISALNEQEAGTEEASAHIRSRVESARERARKRNASSLANAELSSQEISERSLLGSSTRDFLRVAAERFHLSTRSYYRILKVARTIADLAGSDRVQQAHCAEALCYREKVRTLT